MSSEKMREEFELWASSPAFGLREGHFVKGEDGEYLNYPTQCYFMVWQASRESLVVHLPTDRMSSDIAMRMKCRDAIHAAGVKTI